MLRTMKIKTQGWTLGIKPRITCNILRIYLINQMRNRAYCSILFDDNTENIQRKMNGQPLKGNDAILPLKKPEYLNPVISYLFYCGN